jgi:hypothetical protein
VTVVVVSVAVMKLCDVDSALPSSIPRVRLIPEYYTQLKQLVNNKYSRRCDLMIEQDRENDDDDGDDDDNDDDG